MSKSVKLRNYMAEPFHRFGAPERKKIRQILIEQGALP